MEQNLKSFAIVQRQNPVLGINKVRNLTDDFFQHLKFP